MWHAWERGETCTGFWWESPKEKDHLKDQGVDGSKMDVREIGWGTVEWIHLAQDRGHWRTLVNAAMNLRILAPRSYLASIVT
jgi:alpha-glucosidase (family GH31 glycosyl hydrolase)